jgi:DNA-binding SARP family transcriptional activator
VKRSDALENITFDVDELSRLDKMEQAQRLEEAARRIDEVQRAAADNADLKQWVQRQRQYLVDMQHLIYEC